MGEACAVLIISNSLPREQALRSMIRIMPGVSSVETADFIKAIEMEVKDIPDVVLVDSWLLEDEFENVLEKVVGKYPSACCLFIDTRPQAYHLPEALAGIKVLNSDQPTEDLLNAIGSAIQSRRLSVPTDKEGIDKSQKNIHSGSP